MIQKGFFQHKNPAFPPMGRIYYIPQCWDFSGMHSGWIQNEIGRDAPNIFNLHSYFSICTGHRQQVGKMTDRGITNILVPMTIQSNLLVSYLDLYQFHFQLLKNK